MTDYLAIDLGGTKTSISVGDENGQLHYAERIPTEPSQPPEQWRTRVEELIQRVLSSAQVPLSAIKSVGLATPGPMSVATGMVHHPPNMPAWREVPVLEWIKEITKKPVFINNDANAGGLAEFYFGEFKRTPDLVYLTMSTGIGGGIISGGHLVQGANDHGGEVGHFVLDPAGPPCPCGQRGCFEMYCGGANVVRQVRERLNDKTGALIIEESGGSAEAMTISAIARAAHRGDALAVEFWDRYLDRLAQGVGIVAMCFNPSVIVMGTVAIHLGDLLIKPLRERLVHYAWPRAIEALQIKPSALGTRIGDLGALAIALQGL